MKPPVFACAIILLFCSGGTSRAFAQAKPPAPEAKSGAPVAPQTAATPGKWVAPVKGVATVDVVQGASKRAGKELVTTLNIKNTSKGSISLLKVEELWYDLKRTLVSSGATYYKKPFLPGEVIVVEVKSPMNGQPDVSQIQFGHANGKVVATKVKKF